MEKGIDQLLVDRGRKREEEIKASKPRTMDQLSTKKEFNEVSRKEKVQKHIIPRAKKRKRGGSSGET